MDSSANHGLLLRRMQARYKLADKAGKSAVIDGLIAATGYERKYAAALLRGSSVHKKAEKKKRKRSSRVYDQHVKSALVLIWKAANQICSKRLAPFLPELVESLERFGHLKVSPEVRSKVIQLSPATIDRLLKDVRTRHPKGKSTTSPANLLKQTIEVRTFARWDDTEPGFFEGDLVAHCGDVAKGSFLNTLNLTDVATGWVDFVPLKTKAGEFVTTALDSIRQVLPIELIGLDTDNGFEFQSRRLLKYCEQNKITFTHSRTGNRNDQAHIEQKNRTVIRQNVGYERLEGNKAQMRLMELYTVLRLYVNYFQPSAKLIEKERIGARVVKRYDQAQTPCQRLLASHRVSEREKHRLLEEYRSLDPVYLLNQVGLLQRRLLSARAGNRTRLIA